MKAPSLPVMFWRLSENAEKKTLSRVEQEFRFQIFTSQRIWPSGAPALQSGFRKIFAGGLNIGMDLRFQFIYARKLLLFAQLL